jgi:Pregnancy-associated plasma protein-A/Secretion system C-terminal sorting domain
MNKLLLTVLSILTISLSYAQNVGHNEGGCGADAYREQLLKEHPELIEKQKQFERLYQTAVMKKIQEPSWRSSAADIVTIPVVVHVVHLPGTPIGTAENISDAQIQAGILHLNQAFRKEAMTAFDGIGRNPNIVGADVELNFCLAKRDPNDNPTDGIQRIASTFSNTEYFNLGDVQRLNHWDTEKYLNIWLVRCIGDGSPTCSVVSGSIAGFSGLFPGGYTDGIVNLAIFFGNSPTNSKYHIHEVGHYFGVGHTFDVTECTNSNCLTEGDRICDTPPRKTQGAVTVNCGVEQNTCTTDSDDTNARNPFRPIALGGLGDQGDNYENYMDYSRLSCHTMFTEGQKTRARFALDNYRASLKSSTGCVPNATPLAFFSYQNYTTSLYESAISNNLNCLNYEDINIPIQIANTSASVTVNITVGAGTATNMVDFQLLTPSVTIAAGATSGNVILRVFCDSQFETEETIILNISSATSGVTPSNLPHTINIIDDYDFNFNSSIVSSSISSVSKYIAAGSKKVHFKTPTGELLATIESYNNFDIGCVTVEIDRAGANTFINAGKTFASKTYKVTPSNYFPFTQCTITLYYTSGEISGWTSATGAPVSAMGIFHSNGTSISSATSTSASGWYQNYTLLGTSTAFSRGFYLPNTGFLSFGVANNTVLAVDLLNFEGIKGNKNVKLRWKTASEKNNDYFIIEKSRDGQTFEDLAKVTSQGASSDVLNYETLDNAPVAGMNYYRLKSVDKGGKVATSKVVSVAFVEKIKLTVYPNPTTVSKINVELTSDRDERIDFEVVDIVGKTVHTMSQNVTNGLNTIAFDNLTVSKGIYFIRAKQNGIVTEVVRFVRL